MATNVKSQNKARNQHIARRIVTLLETEQELLATEISTRLDVAISTVRAVSNGLIRAEILYRAPIRKATYGLNKAVRHDAFFCSDCNEWNDLDLVSSHGDCRLCGAGLKPVPRQFKMTGEVFTTDLSKPSERELTPQEKLHYGMGRLINQLPMSM